MGVRLQHPQAKNLAAIAALHESVIGGFWQDLVDLVPGWAGDEQQADDLAMSLYELAENSGLRWPTVVPAVSYSIRGSNLVLSCSALQAIEMLELFIGVRTGHWAIVAQVAKEANTGQLQSTVRKSLSDLRRSVRLGAEDETVQAARDLRERLRALL